MIVMIFAFLLLNEIYEQSITKKIYLRDEASKYKIVLYACCSTLAISTDAHMNVHNILVVRYALNRAREDINVHLYTRHVYDRQNARRFVCIYAV